MAFSFTLAKENIFYLASGGVIVFLIFAFLLVPSFYRRQEIARELPRIEGKIKEQRQIKELLGSLQIQMATLEKEAHLPEVKRHPLASAEINTITGAINELAAETGLKLLSLVPELENSERKEGKKLRVDSELQGRSSELSSFLIKILQLPYVGTIRSLSIQAGKGGELIKLTFLVDLA